MVFFENPCGAKVLKKILVLINLAIAIVLGGFAKNAEGGRFQAGNQGLVGVMVMLVLHVGDREVARE
jgi:hypothetical protein